jgi:hypothetical protein
MSPLIINNISSWPCISRDIALTFIHSNFSLVAAEEEFLEIDKELLCQLIASEFLRWRILIFPAIKYVPCNLSHIRSCHALTLHSSKRVKTGQPMQCSAMQSNVVQANGPQGGL